MGGWGSCYRFYVLSGFVLSMALYHSKQIIGDI